MTNLLVVFVHKRGGAPLKMRWVSSVVITEDRWRNLFSSVVHVLAQEIIGRDGRGIGVSVNVLSSSEGQRNLNVFQVIGIMRMSSK